MEGGVARGGGGAGAYGASAGGCVDCVLGCSTGGKGALVAKGYQVAVLCSFFLFAGGSGVYLC